MEHEGGETPECGNAKVKGKYLIDSSFYGRQCQYKQGNIGIMTRSGSLTNEVTAMVIQEGFGVSSLMGIGGDSVPMTRFAEVLPLFEADDDTDAVVVIGELDWSPEVHKQLIGRVNREGQEGQVTAIYLVSDSGSDPLMIDLLGLKSSQAKGIIDPFSGVSKQHSDTDRIRLLAEKYLTKKSA